MALCVAVAYGIPFLGFLVSGPLILATVVTRRRILWPAGTPGRGPFFGGVVAVTGLWLPGLLGFVTPVFYWLGVEVSTSWLIIPLCGPELAVTWVLPAVAASLFVGAAVAISARPNLQGLWLVAMWLAPWVHMAVFQVLPHDIMC
jgi:hypothetical protein